jgi:coenzyme F420-reducing hydrogenase delta subunit
MLFRGLLEFMGIDVQRIHFAWISAAEGAKWAEFVNTVTAHIKKIGPFEHYRQLVGAGIARTT